MVETPLFHSVAGVLPPRDPCIEIGEEPSFDAARGELEDGDLQSLVSGVGLGGNEGPMGFSVSDTGTLLSVPLGLPPVHQLRWYDREGRALGDLGPPEAQYAPRISPDGLRVATYRHELADINSGGAIWVTRLDTGRPSRSTFEEANYMLPVWSFDGSSLVFAKGTRETGYQDLYGVAIRGEMTEELLSELPRHQRPLDASSDGRVLVFSSAPSQSVTDLMIMRLGGTHPTLVPYLVNGFNQDKARLSPDGTWLAYQTNEFGHFEVYVQSFPTPGTKFLISTDGGMQPVWSRDGSELFYHSRRTLMAVSVSSAAGELAVGPPTPLFELPAGTDERGAVEYDVAPDGRFLLNVPVSDRLRTAVVTLNWAAGLD